MDAVPEPDEAAFREDIEGGSFAVGALADQWAIVEVAWPHVLVWIAAAAREKAPLRFYVRLHCAGYPTRGPTGELWDLERKGLLEHAKWPKGRARVAHVFRPDWEGGHSFYHPFDGLALEKHSDWPTKYPLTRWSHQHTIGDWLAEFHELLNSSEYQGV